MTLRTSFQSVITSNIPAPLVTAIQVAFSCLVPFLLAHLALLIGHLTALELATIYIPATGIYYALVSAAEKKWPSWAWLFMLLPSQLPTRLTKTTSPNPEGRFAA